MNAVEETDKLEGNKCKRVKINANMMWNFF